MVRPPDSIRGHWVFQCVERFAAIGAEGDSKGKSETLEAGDRARRGMHDGLARLARGNRGDSSARVRVIRLA